MWKCLKCETLNSDDEICVICAQLRPPLPPTTNPAIVLQTDDVFLLGFLCQEDENGVLKKWTNPAGEFIDFSENGCNSSLYTDKNGKYYIIENGIHYRYNDYSLKKEQWKYSIISANQIRVTCSNGGSHDLFR